MDAFGSARHKWNTVELPILEIIQSSFFHIWQMRESTYISTCVYGKVVSYYSFTKPRNILVFTPTSNVLWRCVVEVQSCRKSLKKQQNCSENPTSCTGSTTKNFPKISMLWTFRQTRDKPIDNRIACVLLINCDEWSCRSGKTIQKMRLCSFPPLHVVWFAKSKRRSKQNIRGNVCAQNQSFM